MNELKRVNPEKQEQKEAFPKVRVEFSFTPHATKEQAEKMRQAFNRADIVMVENYGHNSGGQKVYDDISAGNGNYDELRNKLISNFPDFMGGFTKMVYNSKKIIRLIDFPSWKSEEWGFDHGHISSLVCDAVDSYLSSNTEAALNNVKEAVNDMYNFDKERENFMMSGVVNVAEALAKGGNKRIESLKDKAEVNVLVMAGSTHSTLHKSIRDHLETTRKYCGHTGCYDHLDRIKLNRTSIKGKPYQVFDHLLEATRRLKNNKEEKLDRELLFKIIVDHIVSSLLYDNYFSVENNLEWGMRFIRRVLKDMDIKQMEDLGMKIAEFLDEYKKDSSMLANTKFHEVLSKRIVNDEAARRNLINIIFLEIEKNMQEQLPRNKEEFVNYCQSHHF
jgi:hypothetical protein